MAELLKRFHLIKTQEEKKMINDHTKLIVNHIDKNKEAILTKLNENPLNDWGIPLNEVPSIVCRPRSYNNFGYPRTPCEQIAYDVENQTGLRIIPPWFDGDEWVIEKQQ